MSKRISTLLLVLALLVGQAPVAFAVEGGTFEKLVIIEQVISEESFDTKQIVAEASSNDSPVILEETPDVTVEEADVFKTDADVSEEDLITGTCGDNLTWSLNDNGLLSISGSGYMDNYDPYFDNPSPWNEYRALVKTVFIDEGVRRIGWYAFQGCNTLETVIISDGLEFIAFGAFNGCSSLVTIVIPKSVTTRANSIDNMAFDRGTCFENVYYGGRVTDWYYGTSHPNISFSYIHYNTSDWENHWQEENIEATCTKEGYERTYCACGYERDRVVTSVAVGHIEGKVVKENEVAATCYAEGSYDEVVYCSVCKTHEISRTPKIIEKIDHTPATAVEENRVESTCTVAGAYDSVVYCSVEKCKQELIREAFILETVGHTAGDSRIENEVPATCGKGGSYELVLYCTKCKTELNREIVTTLPTGEHTKGETVVENETAAICTVAGSYDNVVYCTECDAELSRDTIVVPATGEHKDGNHDNKCDACGEVLTKNFWGDADGNGVVNSADAMLILQYSAKLREAHELDLSVSDVDGNGVVNSADAMLILQYSAKLLDKFPASN